MLANPHPNDAAGAAAASQLDDEAGARPARGRLSRLLIRPEAGGVVSAIKDLEKVSPVLDLGNSKITDAGLQNLKGLTQLHVLKLNGSQVTDAGLEHLQGLNQLQQLNIEQTKVTDAGLRHLKGLQQLQILWLKDTKVTREGIQALRQAAQLPPILLTVKG